MSAARPAGRCGAAASWADRYVAASLLPSCPLQDPSRRQTDLLLQHSEGVRSPGIVGKVGDVFVEDLLERVRGGRSSGFPEKRRKGERSLPSGAACLFPQGAVPFGRGAGDFITPV